MEQFLKKITRFGSNSKLKTHNINKYNFLVINIWNPACIGMDYHLLIKVHSPQVKYTTWFFHRELSAGHEFYNHLL